MSQDIESCPQCGADDYETHRPHWADGVAPFKPFCECRCGATWDEDRPIAQTAPVQEPVYQIRYYDNSTAWHDANLAAYLERPEKDRRILYTTPPAAQPAPVQERTQKTKTDWVFLLENRFGFGTLSQRDIDIAIEVERMTHFALSAAQPAPGQYTALEQALTRLQKRYGELEAKAAAQPAVPLTDDEIWKNDDIMAANSGYGADFETLRKVIRATEAAHGITAAAPEKGQP